MQLQVLNDDFSVRNETADLQLNLQTFWHGSMPKQSLCLFKAICRLDMPISV